MNQLISDYKNKYLKYKKKYLDLKYGGLPKYILPHLRPFAKNYYVNIKESLLLDLNFSIFNRNNKFKRNYTLL